jgi:hypothetical protein
MWSVRASVHEASMRADARARRTSDPPRQAPSEGEAMSFRDNDGETMYGIFLVLALIATVFAAGVHCGTGMRP